MRIRKTEWSWPVESGWTREVIGGYWVEWRDVRPTAQQVADQWAPSQTTRDNEAKQAAKDAMTHTTPLVRLMRSSDRVTYKSVVQVRKAFNDLLAILAQGRFPTAQEKAALQLPILTWAKAKQVVQTEIDNDDPAN